METKHTHGPWKASSNGLIFGGNFATTQICDTGWCFWSNRLHELMQSDIVPPDKTQEFLRENIEISKANAKLIAAAPDLLEACQLLISRITDEQAIGNIANYIAAPAFIEATEGFVAAFDKAQSAIQKATE